MLLPMLLLLTQVGGCVLDLSSSSGVHWIACRNNQDCIPHAIVPGTALVNLMANNTWGDISDPFLDDILNTIPDISVTGSVFWTLQYQTSFSLPSSCMLHHDSQVILEIDQINYRADVWVDEVLVSPLGGRSQASGMFQRFTFKLGSPRDSYRLKIQVFPPDHPGNGSNTCTVCGQGGNHQLAQDVTSQYSAGWDWIGSTPDRNTGIIGAIRTRVVGNVLLKDPVAAVQIQSSTHLQDPSSTANVSVKITVALQSLLSTAGVLRLEIPELGYLQEMSVSSTLGIWVDETFPEFSLLDIDLWWPHTLGSPRLYEARISFFEDQTTQWSETVSWRIGFRTVSSYIDSELGGRVFRVNGHRIYLEGGNWIATDQLNRYNADSDRYYSEVRLHRDAGLNLIRLWGGAGGHGKSLYDAGDELGVLMMMEFWMSGDNNGRWAGDYSWPLDHQLYLDAAADTIGMLRGHPSVLFYCGGNELFPNGENPPADIARSLPQLIKTLDPTDRTYIPSSMSSWENYDPEYALAPQDGPYGIMDERQYFARNPGMKNSGKIAFQPEIGNVACPEYESLTRFLSEDVLADFPPENCDVYSVNSIWGFHKYLPFTDDQGVDHIYAYGSPVNSFEYAFRAQLAQFRQYQALFEGFAEHMFEYYGSVIMWKTQSPWPAFRGALYDSYLATNGGFWGVRAATVGFQDVNHLHIQLNQAYARVSIINRGLQTYSEPFSVAVQAYDISSGRMLVNLHLKVNTPIMPQSVQRLPNILQWPSGAPSESVLLWRLSLLKENIPQASSDYWLSNLNPNPSIPQDYNTLGVLRSNQAAYLDVDASISHFEYIDDGRRISVNVKLYLSESAGAVAFGCRVSLMNTVSATKDDRILPVRQDANYFSLVPGESRLVVIVFEVFDGSGVVKLDGWNVKSQLLTIF